MRTYVGWMIIEAVVVLLVVFGAYRTFRKYPKASNAVFMFGCLAAIILAGSSIALTV